MRRVYSSHSPRSAKPIPPESNLLITSVCPPIRSDPLMTLPSDANVDWTPSARIDNAPARTPPPPLLLQECNIQAREKMSALFEKGI
ncbi:hypothetical protein Zmor_013953 [Zophobas morio]|uniref:Uncharacterized protein n=1 Tax=Zophobas morio TaxID=2755281 RepID=A0AA38IES2_9CUCU|nr:hypothetical protein Zmor_013953 [Zophobas morio]